VATTVERVEQRVMFVSSGQKQPLLASVLGDPAIERVLVFTRTKHGADKLTRSLENDGIRAVAMHGNKSQNLRTRALADFKAGKVSVMVATDIAARGIDIDQLPHVVNFDLPNVPEDYVHRIGRTGRAGSSGEAISLVCVDERAFLRDIERLIKRSIPQTVIAGFEPDPRAVAQPVFAPRGRARTQGARPATPSRNPRHGQARPAAPSNAYRGRSQKKR
jgi:ATP-dependent RNA helicase RhlE